jgi:ribosomal protein S18 acetylase RimI-like enzyme
MATVRFGALDSRHRGRLAEVLAATAVFSRDEIAIALELFDETFGDGSRNAEDTAALAPPAALRPLPAYEFLGAFDDQTLVGYACYGPTPGADGIFDLYWIAVHPGAQGAGAGSGLLDEVERRLRERGGRLVIVETSSRAAYQGTRRFYDARGYREAARVADFYAPADDRVIYAKRLLARAAPAAQLDHPSTDSRGARHHE